MGIGRMIGSGLPPLTLDSIAAAKAKAPKYRKTTRTLVTFDRGRPGGDKSVQVTTRVNDATGRREVVKVETLSKPPKKSRKLPSTPRSRVRSALRQVWLRSREHQACLKAAGRSCEHCGVKASVAKGKEVKVQVHHKHGIANWEAVIDLVFAELLVSPELLESVCELCHKAEHGGLGGGKAGKGRSKR